MRFNVLQQLRSDFDWYSRNFQALYGIRDHKKRLRKMLCFFSKFTIVLNENTEKIVRFQSWNYSETVIIWKPSPVRMFRIGEPLRGLFVLVKQIFHEKDFWSLCRSDGDSEWVTWRGAWTVQSPVFGNKLPDEIQRTAELSDSNVPTLPGWWNALCQNIRRQTNVHDKYINTESDFQPQSPNAGLGSRLVNQWIINLRLCIFLF